MNDGRRGRGRAAVIDWRSLSAGRGEASTRDGSPRATRHSGCRAARVCQITGHRKTSRAAAERGDGEGGGAPGARRAGRDEAGRGRCGGGLIASASRRG